jgi:hypothetical protein
LFQQWRENLLLQLLGWLNGKRVTGRFKLTHPGSLQNDPPWRG